MESEIQAVDKRLIETVQTDILIQMRIDMFMIQNGY